MFKPLKSGGSIHPHTNLRTNALHDRDERHQAHLDDKNGRPEGVLTKDGVLPGQQLHHGCGHAGRSGSVGHGCGHFRGGFGHDAMFGCVCRFGACHSASALKIQLMTRCRRAPAFKPQRAQRLDTISVFRGIETLLLIFDLTYCVGVLSLIGWCPHLKAHAVSHAFPQHCDGTRLSIGVVCVKNSRSHSLPKSFPLRIRNQRATVSTLHSICLLAIFGHCPLSLLRVSVSVCEGLF